MQISLCLWFVLFVARIEQFEFLFMTVFGVDLFPHFYDIVDTYNCGVADFSCSQLGLFQRHLDHAVVIMDSQTIQQQMNR